MLNVSCCYGLLVFLLCCSTHREVRQRPLLQVTGNITEAPCALVKYTRGRMPRPNTCIQGYDEFCGAQDKGAASRLRTMTAARPDPAVRCSSKA
jgi:hypothetical protein